MGRLGPLERGLRGLGDHRGRAAIRDYLDVRAMNGCPAKEASRKPLAKVKGAVVCRSAGSP